MNILFDSQIFNAQRYGGISRYFSRIAIELNLLNDVTALIYSPLYINQYLDSPLAKAITYGVRANEKYHLPAKIISHIMTHLNLQLKPPDIIHNTYYYPEKYPSKRSRSVVTVYDMIHELFPENFSNRNLTSKFKLRAVERADQRHLYFRKYSIRPIKDLGYKP